MITYWSYIGTIFFIYFIPGFAIATHFKKLSTIEQMAVSFGFSYVVLSLLVPFFAFKLFFLPQFLFTGIMVASLWFLLKRRSVKLDADARFLMLVLSISLISKFFLQTLWEYPVMGGDWFGHAFARPYRFEIGDWMPDRDRTPLFNLLIYAYHRLLGTSLYQYWVSQIISVVINSVYLFPAYLIAKKAFGDWVAKFSVLFMLITPFLIFNTLYTWPKNAAMYGVLMMVYFLFFSEHDIKLRYPLAGFFAGLGFWFHNYAVFYIGIAVLLLIYKEKMYEGLFSRNILNNLKKISYFLLVLIVALAPYFAWVYSYYGTLSTSRFIYYPIAVKGSDSALLDDENELFNTFYSTPLKEIIMIRISNAIITLTPAALPVNPVATNFPTYSPIYYYTHDYPGALSTLMYLAVAVWFVKYMLGKTKTDIIIVSFILYPFLINLFLWGYIEWGLVVQILHPTIPLLVMLGTNEICSIEKSRIRSSLVYIVFAGAAVEGFIYSKLIATFYKASGGLDNVSKMGLEFIPDFQVSNFVSAHFLLNRASDMLTVFLISSGMVVLVYILLYGNLKKR